MPRKGEMKPVSVVIKIRQGRKACTLLTGYEPFGLQAEELAEELRKACASSTSGVCHPPSRIWRQQRQTDDVNSP